MTFYFDYSTMLKWSGTPTGIPRTVYCLAQAFQEIYPKVKLVGIDDELEVFHDVKLTPKGVIAGQPTAFIKDDVLLSVGANWAFSCYNKQIREIREKGTRFYQLFFDIIPYLFPYLFEDGKGFGDYFGAWTLETLALCDGAFAISECSKKDIEELAKSQAIPHRKIKVVRLGEDFSGIIDKNHEHNRFSKLENFILSVGTLEIRKNQTCLLNAYRLLNRKYRGRLPKLVLVGRSGWIDGNIPFQVEHDRELVSLVEVVTDASDQELESLYDSCLFTVFPAIYEGWGLPVAESLKHSKPCISSNTSSMLEINFQLTRFASPYSTEAWVEQIEDLLFSQGKLESETCRIKSEYTPTKWTETATTMLDYMKGSFK